MTRCIEGFVSGYVQGVSYRQFTQQHARMLGITGWVKNLDDGRVAFHGCGSVAAIEQWLVLLEQGPPHASVRQVEYCDAGASNWHGFDILR